MRALRIIIFIALIPIFSNFQCYEDWEMTQYTPIIMAKSDLPASIFVQPAREFENPGKIYLFNNYVFIVDIYTGVHIINNTNPETPDKIGFIHISGVVDIAIKNNVLFADNAIDLVAIDLSNYPEIEVIDRIPDVFPELTPPDLQVIPSVYASWNRAENTVIVGWIK
jgi:hypothetical protein